jgi:hypothetical protein
MKNKNIFSILFLFSLVINQLTAQTAVVRISNLSLVSGTTVQFDIEIQASAGTIYLGNTDIKFTFNASKFSSPAISRVSATSTLKNAANDNVTYSIASSLTAANELTINIPSPAPADQTDFDERVAKVTNTFVRISTFRLTNFTGIAASESAFACQATGTIISTHAPTTPFAESQAAHSCNVLPLDLVDFTAKTEKDNNILNWQTASEQQVRHFEIEKAVSNNPSFEKIGEIKAIGNSTTPQYYTYLDKNPSNLDFYRLKMVDYDGQSKFSKTISLARKTGLNARFYPNPATDVLHIAVEQPFKTMTVALLDLTGKIITHQSWAGSADNNLFNLNLKQMPNGVFTAVVTIDGVQMQHKVVVAQ